MRGIRFSRVARVLALSASFAVVSCATCQGGPGTPDGGTDGGTDAGMNAAPAANAGADRALSLPAGAATVDVTLDGSASTDTDGTVVGYTWTGTPDPDDVAQPVVSLSEGTYTFTLVVTDDDGDDSPPDSVSITVTPSVPQWSATYGYGDAGTDNGPVGIVSFPNGDAAFLANTSSAGQGQTDLWVVRLHDDGTIAWEKAIGGERIDVAASIHATSDGGLVLSGHTYNTGEPDSHPDAWVLRLDADGNVLWQSRFGGPSIDWAHDVVETVDAGGNPDGYIMTGWTKSSGFGNMDVWVVRLDLAGAVVWQKIYGGYWDDIGRVIRQTQDGFLVAATMMPSLDDTDVWLFEIDSTGTWRWGRTFDASHFDIALALLPHGDGWLLAGSAENVGAGDTDAWVVAVDKDGEIVWQRAYGGAGNDNLRDMVAMPGGGYIGVGWTYSFGAQSNDAWALAIDDDGNVLWAKRYDKPAVGEHERSDWAHAITAMPGGGYAVVGETEFWDLDRNGDIWVLRLAPDGSVGCGLEAAVTPVVTETNAQTNEEWHNYLEPFFGFAAGPGIVVDTAADVSFQCGP